MKKIAFVYFCLVLVTLTAEALKSCSSGYRDERDGRDGINGRDGLNGCDGRDGVDGKNGTDGVNGSDGKNGKDGLNGKDGINGKDGMHGKHGIAGLNGNNGKDGKDGRDGQNAVRNWKQCAWKNVNDSKDNGMIKTCSFKKNSANTYLKIVVSSNMRITNCNNCCKRWFITINGKECQDPVPIDGVVYMRTGSQQDLVRPRVVRGVCKISVNGMLSIALNVGNCPSYGNADAHTGWNSSTNIYIEELDSPQV